MSRATRKILSDALALPEDERLKLATELIASVDGPPDADWEEAWQAEVERRIVEAEQRGTPAADWVDVRARILSQLGRQ
jgi:putative addiction module component (TIGR02574 family)